VKLCLIILLSLCSLSGATQEIFSGMVGDSATFVALPFVTIQVKGRHTGTTTDVNGNFSISATRADTLLLSSVGYKTLAYPLAEWEPGIILLSEHATLLDDVTITDTRSDPYQGMFDEQNEALRKANRPLPFYYTKAKKQKIKVGRLTNENIRVQTYVDVVIKNEKLREGFIEKYRLTDAEYFKLLSDFNAKHYSVMYYLSAPELLSLLNSFFAAKAPLK
jgi:hypothetical protein